MGQAQSSRIGGARAGRRVVAFAGGRGGIGRSVLAANIGVYLAQLGKDVVLVDADLGGASQHTLLGLPRSGSSLAQVIDRTADHIVDVIIDTPIPNLRLLSGVADRFGVANLRPTQKERLLQQLRAIDADVVLLDAGSGTAFNVLDLFLVADYGVLVVVPEPTAVEAVYRFVKSAVIRLVRREVGRKTQWPQVLDDTVARLGGLPSPLELRDALVETAPTLADLVEAARLRLRPRLVVNRSKVRSDFELGPAMRTLAGHHLGIAFDYLGYIEADDAVWLATRKRRPLMIEAPGTQAAKDIERISRRILAPASAERIASTSAAPRAVEMLNHYEVLEVDVGAREDEIRRGYKRLRDFYREDSMASYSVLDDGAAQAMLERAQAAYDTLLDPKSRRAYDLALPKGAQGASKEMLEEDTSLPAYRADRHQPQPPPEPPMDVDINPDTEFSGSLLRRLREAQGVELRDITARTKIGTSYLQAIEEEDFANLPALVYTRGFVAEVAKYLDLNHQHVVKTYIKRFRKYLEETGKLE